MSESLIFCDYCGAANQDSASSCFSCHRVLSSPHNKPSTTALTPMRSFQDGRYRVLSTIGQGGYGAVYQAVDTRQHDQLVAIKSVSLRGLRSGEIIEATETFHRELDLLSTLSHPYLPHLHASFSDPEHWYLVMDYIHGQTLEEYLQASGGRLPLTEVHAIGLCLCDVLEYLHTRQPPVIFRDVKPANIMREQTGRLFLIDFGIARRFRPGMRRDTSLLGSPGYAAPEQYGQAQTSPQTDIYGLGITLWQLLSGQDPTTTAITEETISLASQVPPIPNDFKRLLVQMLSSKPEDRPASVRVVRERLRMLEMRVSRGYYPLPGGTSVSTSPATSRSGTGTTFPAGGATLPSAGTIQGTLQQHLPQATTQVQSAQPHKRVMTRRKAIIGIAGALAVLGGVSWLQHRTTTPALLTYTGHQSEVHAVAWERDGGRIASGDQQGIVHVWDSTTGQTLQTLQDAQLGARAVNAVSWSPDAQSLLVGYENAVTIWDLSRGAPTLVWPSISGPVAWSPDGNYIAVQGQNTSGNPALLILDGRSGVLSYPPVDAQFQTLAWSPDSKWLIGGGTSGLKAWSLPGVSLAPGLSSADLTGLQNVLALAWSPDASSISVGDTDGVIQTLSLADGSLVDQFAVQQAVYALAWSPHNTNWAPAAADGSGTMTISIYGDGRKTITAGNQPIFSISWSPDGKWLAGGGADTTVGVWLPPT